MSAALLVLDAVGFAAASAKAPNPTLRVAGYGVVQTAANESGSQDAGSPGHCHILAFDGNLSPRPFLVEPVRAA